MPPMLRTPRGPEGRNNKPNRRPDLHRGSRQDAGVDWRVRLPCASRRTRRRCANLERGHPHIRAKA